MTETPQELLDAVGYDWTARHSETLCPECFYPRAFGESQTHEFNCRRPDTSNVAPTYTGPALGTPELDALLLVAGYKWVRENRDRHLPYVLSALPDNKFSNPTLTLLLNDTPGHALARAIAEVNHA